MLRNVLKNSMMAITKRRLPPSHKLVSKFGFLRANTSYISAKDTIFLPQITLWDFLKGPMHQRGDQVAVECGFTGRRYTYQQLIEMSDQLASGLQSLGVRQGDVVAVCLPNLPEIAAFLLATAKIGAVFSAANPIFTAGELHRQLTMVKSEVLITASKLLPVVEDAIKDTSVKHVVLVDGQETQLSMMQMLTKPAGPYEDVEIAPLSDTVLLPFSSGTTGEPKGVMLTHYNVVSNVLQMRASPHISSIRSSDQNQIVQMAVLPMYHIYALVCILIFNLHDGGKVITLPMFSPQTFQETMEKYHFNTLHLVPTLAKFIVESSSITEKHLNDVVQVTCGSAPLGTTLAEKLVKKAGKRIVFTEGYGLTETSPTVTMSGDRLGSVGQLVANTHAKVVKPTTKNILGAHEEGEFYVRGPQVMKGYLGSPETTAAAFDDGWFCTGDIAYYDEDEYFYITGRIKELIKVKGYQVSPSELERILKKHPDVFDACVVGVPDEKLGELLKAFIVKKNEQLTETDITSFLHPQVAAYKQLTGGVIFINRIPRSSIGKVLRQELLTLKQQNEN